MELFTKRENTYFEESKENIMKEFNKGLKNQGNF